MKTAPACAVIATLACLLSPAAAGTQPGLELRDVKVEVTDEAVVIEGERKQEHEEKRGSVYRRECTYGRFHRSVPLPAGVNVSDARASFKNGVLEVVMLAPDLAASRGRQIEIQAG